MDEEVARQRQYIGGRGILAPGRAVIGSHDQNVFTGRNQRLGGIQPEAGEAPRMIAQRLAIQPDALAPHFGGDGEALPITAQALRLVDRLGTVDVARGIGPVEPDAVPGMRDRYGLPFGIVEAGLDGIRRRITLVEAPILIEDECRTKICWLPNIAGCLRPAGDGLKTCQQDCCSSRGCKTTGYRSSPISWGHNTSQPALPVCFTRYRRQSHHARPALLGGIVREQAHGSTCLPDGAALFSCEQEVIHDSSKTRLQSGTDVSAIF